MVSVLLMLLFKACCSGKILNTFLQETPVAHIRSGCKPCLKQNLMQEKILSDSFKPSRNKLTKDDVTLRRKNYSLLRDSPLFSRVLYSPLYTGCKLKRSHTAALSSSTPETSNSVYDQLFELAQNKNGK